MPGHFFACHSMHPLTRLFAVLCLAVLVQWLAARWLLATGLMVLLANIYCSPDGLFRLLRRSRWLFLMLLVIYAFATPGEYIAGWPLATAPTYEGIIDGVLQAARLAIMLMGIALLLATTPRAGLIAGIYLLLKPLGCCGLSPEKFASRLWLTLHYVEQQPARFHWRGWQSFAATAKQAIEEDQALVLEIQTLRRVDWLACLSMCAVALWVGLQ